MDGLASALFAKFPDEAAFWKVTSGRTVQFQKVTVFLSTVAFKIVSNGETLDAVQNLLYYLQIAGSWKIFFDNRDWGNHAWSHHHNGQDNTTG